MGDSRPAVIDLSMTHFVYIIFYDPFIFPNMCFGFRLDLVDQWTEFVPSSLAPFIGHHQGLFANVKFFLKF